MKKSNWRNLSFITFIILIVTSCASFNQEDELKEEIKNVNTFFSSNNVKLEGDLKTFTYEFESSEDEEGIQILKLKLHSDIAETPPKFSLKWQFPSVDIYSFWNSNLSVDKVNYYRNSITARASSQAPVLCFMNNKDENRFSVAVSDALNKTTLYSELIEEDANFHCSIDFFIEPTAAVKEYEVELRFDLRSKKYHLVLADISNWWAGKDAYKPAPVPDDAKQPMYSTWYSFHQSLDVDEIIQECKLGKELGLEAVIVDDGWQTMDSQRGYAYTGDWNPDRISDMRGFVDSIHQIGMNFLLWYSLPFMGEKARNYELFQGKYLRYWESQGTYVLDPRYPEVREFIINTYEKALRDWELDGFKLDFIGWFAPVEDTKLTAEDGRDFGSIYPAVDRLMTDIMSRLRKKKPDIMIEFRQTYIGPLMRKYGNMFRAADCPNMAVVNRVRTVDIRLLSGNTAPHSDMFMWHNNDPVENAALQILNILHAVPQLSVKLNSIPKDHFKMVEFWISYWKENRDVLMDGDFYPQNPGALYPIIYFSNEEKQIVALYNQMVAIINGDKRESLDVINASGNTEVYLDFEKQWGKRAYRIYDCMGNLIKRSSAFIEGGLIKFEVPPSGVIKFYK